jgi:excisionase family DNA binding protein
MAHMSSRNNDIAYSNDQFPRLALSIAAAAKALGVGRTRFYQLLKDGEIAAIRCGGRVLVPVSELSAFVAKAPPVRFASKAVANERSGSFKHAPKSR